VLSGCVRQWPVFYAPVWSPDGKTLYYAVAQADGKLAIRQLDLAANQSSDVSAVRLDQEPRAIALSPQGDSVALAVLEHRQRGRPRIQLHVATRGRPLDRAVWEAPTARGIVDLCWTPDGKAIVAAADKPGGWALWRVAADGGAKRLLLDDLAALRAPAVSPDGARVAFVARSDAGGPWSLYVTSLEGGERRLVVPAIFARFRLGYEPAWSPDGNAVAYVAERYLREGFAEIWLWQAETRRRRALARTLAGACIAPAWSPKGQALAFVRLPFGAGPSGPGSGGRQADIALVPSAGGKLRPLVADGLANLMPAWSPDGRTIAFGTCAGPAAGPHVVRLVDVETGKVKLAHDAAPTRFLMASAQHLRGSRAALKHALAEAPRIADRETKAYAHRILAERYAANSQWQAAATHAQQAVAAAHRPWRLKALRLLAQAQMRLGKPKGALAAAERLLAEARDNAAAQLRDRLRQGLQVVAGAHADTRANPTPEALRRLAGAHLRQLGNPRKALELCFRLLNEFPSYSGLADPASVIFDCYAQLGAEAASHRVLERAAKIIGETRLTREHTLLLAEAAAAGGEAEAALRWLDRLSKGGSPRDARDRMAAVCLRAAEQFGARGELPKALAAWKRARRTGSRQLAARAALKAGEMLGEMGQHHQAARHLVAALEAEAKPATVREALRLLTAARRKREDPVAYDAARVGELVTFGFLGTAITLGEQIITGLPEEERPRHAARRYLATAFERLVAYHLACDQVEQAQSLVRRWLRHAAPQDDLPRALAKLAACQERAGQREALVLTLSRLTLEFPDRPEAAEARRQLLRLNAAGRGRRAPPAPER